MPTLVWRQSIFRGSIALINSCEKLMLVGEGPHVEGKCRSLYLELVLKGLIKGPGGLAPTSSVSQTLVALYRESLKIHPQPVCPSAGGAGR